MKVIYNGAEYYSNDAELFLAQDESGYTATIARYFDGTTETLTSTDLDLLIRDAVNYLYNNIERSVTVRIQDSDLSVENQAFVRSLVPTLLNR